MLGLYTVRGEEDGPVEITDRKLWERELTDHLRWHAADLHDSPVAGTKPGLWLSTPKLALWTIMVMVLTSAGWIIGLYFI
ncbi:MAG: hypothetical protein ACRDRY_18545 [Pseudonocardiaceae bacterium]